MKQVNGFCLPDGEEHLVSYLENGPEFAGGPTYQLHKLMAALPHVKNFRKAIDIGAHCGLWTRPMAAMFREVLAFEPLLAHRECFRANMQGFGVTNTVLINRALGNPSNPDETVKICTKGKSSGDARISPDGDMEAPLACLDSYSFTGVDFIKIDCEGFEYFILKGGEETIRRNRPTIVVEQKPGKGAAYGIADTAAVKLLAEWGAVVKWEHGGDFCLRFR